MRFKEKLLLSGLLWAIAATSANAVVVLSQNFDDTAVFDASDITPRSVGDSSTQGGEWGVFDEGNVNPADFNGNGIGDAADYTAWRDGLGSTYTLADYDVWKSHFGQTAGSGSAEASPSHASVPEPTLGCLALAICLSAGLTRVNFCSICRARTMS